MGLHVMKRLHAGWVECRECMVFFAYFVFFVVNMRNQNGLTVTRMTIAISSSTGISLNQR